MLGWDVQANQKRPTTRMTPPTIMGGSRSSGMTFLALLNLGVKMTFVSHARETQAMSTPMKMAMKGSDPILGLIPRSPSKLKGYAKKIK
jgi:hypothetical protein